MARKISVLVIAVSLLLFILIVNAADEKADEGSADGTQNLNDLAINRELEVDNAVEKSQNKSQTKPATAGFGVYLEIVG